MLVFKCKFVNDQNYSVIKIEQAPHSPQRRFIFLLIPIQTIQIKEKILHSTQMFGQTPWKETKKKTKTYLRNQTQTEGLHS